MSERLDNLQELSAAINVPVRKIKEWQRERKIPCIRMGHRSVYYSRDKVLAAIAKFEVKAVA